MRRNKRRVSCTANGGRCRIYDPLSGIRLLHHCHKGCDYQFRLPLGSILGVSLFSGLSPEVVIGAFGDFEGGSINGTSSFPGFTGSEVSTR